MSSVTTGCTDRETCKVSSLAVLSLSVKSAQSPAWGRERAMAPEGERGGMGSSRTRMEEKNAQDLCQRKP